MIIISRERIEASLYLFAEEKSLNEIYGYVRASSKDQNEDRQLIALSDFPVPQKNIYMDKLSGKDFNMPQYKRLLNMIEEEDVLVIKSIDRLGRNYSEILDQWRYLTKNKKAYKRFLWIFTGCIKDGSV